MFSVRITKGEKAAIAVAAAVTYWKQALLHLVALKV